MAGRDTVLDPLTGLLTPRALTTRLGEIAAQAALAGGSVCVVACQLDQYGDGVLAAAGSVLRRNLRHFELAYRLGGGTLLVVLPGSTLDDGIAVAERVRASIESEPLDGAHVTASLGVAAAYGADVAFDRLLRQVTSALRRAQDEGRNRVIAADVFV